MSIQCPVNHKVSSLASGSRHSAQTSVNVILFLLVSSDCSLPSPGSFFLHLCADYYSVEGSLGILCRSPGFSLRRSLICYSVL